MLCDIDPGLTLWILLAFQSQLMSNSFDNIASISAPLSTLLQPVLTGVPTFHHLLDYKGYRDVSFSAKYFYTLRGSLIWNWDHSISHEKQSLRVTIENSKVEGEWWRDVIVSMFKLATRFPISGVWTMVCMTLLRGDFDIRIEQSLAQLQFDRCSRTWEEVYKQPYKRFRYYYAFSLASNGTR